MYINYFNSAILYAYFFAKNLIFISKYAKIFIIIARLCINCQRLRQNVRVY